MTKLKGAFIGFGNIAELGHWPAYAKASAGKPSEVEMVAAMDSSPARRQKAQALGLRVYDNVDELFRTENLDFVDICTPPSSHAELALKALERQCHVLCEKPLTLKPADY